MKTVELNLKIQISEKTIKIIQAISKVSGRSTEDIKQEILQKIEDEFESSLIQKLLHELDIEGAMPVERIVSNTRKQASPARIAAEVHNDNQDTTGISEGLGDDDEDPEEPTIIGGLPNPEAAVTANGATDKDLDHEMDIDDPNVEAKSAAVEASPEASAEETFSDILNLPPVPVDERALKRKKQPKSRAIITGMNAFPNDAT